ncbi:MAG: hypothetical protein ABFC62_01535 [Clostridiaceae bacterium]
MKKIALIVVALSILLVARPAFAKPSTIRYDAEGPHFTMGVLEDCEIGIEHEDLGFDIHFEEKHPSFMDVTASYEMLNYGKKQTVTMAFPLLFTLGTADALQNARVSVDGVAIEARHMLVSSVEHLRDLEALAGSSLAYDEEAYLKYLNLGSLLSYLSAPVPFADEPGSAKYQEDDILDIYTLQSEIAEDDSYLKIVWPQGVNKEPIAYGTDIGYVFYGNEKEVGSIEIGFSSETAGEIVNAYVAVPSGIDLSQSQTYLCKKDRSYVGDDGKIKYGSPPPKAGPELTYKESMSVKDFIYGVCMPQLLTRYPQAAQFEDSDELYYLICRELQQSDNPSLGWALSDVCSQNMMGLLVYDVPFATGQARQVEVSYRQTPSYYSKYSSDIRADYTYLTNPATYYRSFGTLDVTVRFMDRPKQLTSNVVSKTAAVFFEEKDANTYFASVNGLPQKQLVFSVYCVDEWPQKWTNLLLYGIFLSPLFVVGGVLIASIGLIAYAIYRRRKKKKAASQNALPEGESIPEKEGYYKRPQ